MTTRFPAATTALEHLAAALDPAEFALTLTTGTGRPPRLTVASRHAHISGDIHADPTAYWWTWGERIGPISDPPAAASKSAARCAAPRQAAHDRPRPLPSPHRSDLRPPRPYAPGHTPEPGPPEAGPSTAHR